jgi:hypothetical protein
MWSRESLFFEISSDERVENDLVEELELCFGHNRRSTMKSNDTGEVGRLSPGESAFEGVPS